MDAGRTSWNQLNHSGLVKMFKNLFSWNQSKPLNPDRISWNQIQAENQNCYLPKTPDRSGPTWSQPITVLCHHQQVSEQRTDDKTGSSRHLCYPPTHPLQCHMTCVVVVVGTKLLMFPAKLFDSIITSTRAATALCWRCHCDPHPTPFNCHLEITSFSLVPEGSARR